ncbi:hypothetical protein LTR10_001755 [Elasticomyces elasticus]|nr:hypothetical protein LTR10_001755 [Elasticomyces elasticus]KAK4975254.1 hypothetical protein LTR42_004464 [Elasticomyces elasticus]
MGGNHDKTAILHWCDNLQVSRGKADDERRQNLMHYTTEVYPYLLAPYHIIKEGVGHTSQAPRPNKIQARLSNPENVVKYNEQAPDWARFDYVDMYCLAVHRVRTELHRAGAIARELDMRLSDVPKMPSNLGLKQQVKTTTGYITFINKHLHMNHALGLLAKNGNHKRFLDARREFLANTGFEEHRQRIVDEGKQVAAGPSLIERRQRGMAELDSEDDEYSEDKKLSRTRKRKAGSSGGVQGRKRCAILSEDDDDASYSEGEKTLADHVKIRDVGRRSTRATDVTAKEATEAIDREDKVRSPMQRKAAVKEDMAASVPAETHNPLRPDSTSIAGTPASEHVASVSRAPPPRTAPPASKFVDLTMDDEADSVLVKQEVDPSGGGAGEVRERRRPVGVDDGDEDEDDVPREMKLLEIEERKLKCEQRLKQMQKKTKAKAERSG